MAKMDCHIEWSPLFPTILLEETQLKVSSSFSRPFTIPKTQECSSSTTFSGTFFEGPSHHKPPSFPKPPSRSSIAPSVSWMVPHSPPCHQNLLPSHIRWIDTFWALLSIVVCLFHAIEYIQHNTSLNVALYQSQQYLPCPKVWIFNMSAFLKDRFLFHIPYVVPILHVP